MGSFNATCIVSNLPIEAGTPVRYVLLTRSKYHPDGNGHVCYVSGRWQLRSAALRAEYNDYGSVEDIQDDLSVRVAFEALSRDALERGVGDNQCHDVQVRSGMSRKEWLTALWEGRVFVEDFRRPEAPPDGWKVYEPEEGIPSLSRLEAVLKSEGHAVVTGWGARGFFLDQVSHGFIRVRHGRDSGEGDPKELGDAVAAFQKAGYAAMVTCGTGMYSNHAEVLVAPLPAPPGKHRSATGLQRDEFHEAQSAARPVSQAMIREDVWQILLSNKVGEWRDGGYSFPDMLKAARSAMKKRKASREKIEKLKSSGGRSDLMEALMLESNDRLDPDFQNPFVAALHESEGVCGFSLKASLKLAEELAGTPEELDGYVVSLAETAYVQWAYSELHGQWHPTTNSGQDGNWEGHRKFLTSLLGVKGRWEDEQE